MEPKNLENNIKIIPDNILAESFVFQFTPLGENDPVAQMKMLAADYLVLQHIPTSTETLNMISDLIEKGTHLYCGSIESFKPNHGYGIAVWELAEKLLVFHEKKVIRYISDKSDSYWTSRNLDTILEYLEGNNVAVTPLFFPQLNDTPEYIFLFEKK